MDIKDLNYNKYSNKRIGVFRTDRLGDMILTLPMFESLKLYIPNSTTVLICSKYLQPLLKHYSSIDEIYYIEDHKNIYKLLKSLKIDIIFFPRPKLREVFFSFLSFVKNRIGTGYRWYSIFLNYKIFTHRKIGIKNEADYNIELINKFFQLNSEILIPSFKFTNSDIDKLKSKLINYNINYSKPIICLHPGSGGSSLDWDSSNFNKLANELSNYNLQIILTGSKSEESLNNIVMLGNKAINLTGIFDLYELALFYSLCTVFVSNSTGTIHLASVVGTYTIGIYPNSPHLSATRWGPIGKSKKIFSPKNETNSVIYNDNVNQIDSKLISNEILKYLKIIS